MSIRTRSFVTYIRKIKRHDPDFWRIYLHYEKQTDAEVAELIDCMLDHPNAVRSLELGGNMLTDETEVKLARYVASSSVVRYLDLRRNQLGPATYFAMAAALQINTSLKFLFLAGNQTFDKNLIDMSFVDALQLNPNRLADSRWCLYVCVGYQDEDFERLRATASELGHPSLQMILNRRLTMQSIRSIRR